MVANIGGNNTNGILRNLGDAQSKKNSLLEKLATGKRINRAKDDAAGLAIVEDLAAASKTLGQASRNISDFNSVFSIADSSLEQIGGIQTRLQELATQSANGTLSDGQRAALQSEFDALREEAGRIAATSEFNGVNTLQGNNLTAQVGQDGSSTSQISVDGADVSSVLGSLNSLDISTQAGAQQALDTISNDVGPSIARTRGTYGAAQSRLEAAQANAETQRIGAEEAASRIRDADIADTTARATAQDIRANAGAAVLAQANQSKQNVLRLLS